MKRVTSPLSSALPGPLRLGVATAKARLSEVLRRLQESPVVIHSRGKDLGVLVDMGSYGRIADSGRSRGGGAAFVAAVAALRERWGGVEGFEPRLAQIAAEEPFARRRRR